MSKYLLIAVLFCSTAFAATTESVALEQKANVVKITVTLDGAALLAEFNKAKTDIAAQRASALADKTQKDADGKDVTIALTQEQKNFVNTAFDQQLASAKRTLQLKMLDAASKALQTSINRTAYDDDAIEQAKAAEKAKIDAEYAKRESLKPTLDVDAVK